MENPVRWNALPEPFLARLFQELVFQMADRCKMCKRPFWWTLRSKEAWIFRSVCKRWRTAFFKICVVNPMMDGRFVSCIEPTRCIRVELDQVIAKEKENKKVYYRINGLTKG